MPPRNTPPAPETGPRSGARIEWALIAVGLLILFVSEKHRLIGDGMTRHVSLRLLFERGELSDMGYSMVGPIFAAPLYWLDRLSGTPLWWASRYNFFLFAGGLLVLHRALSPLLDPRTVRVFLLVLVAGSMFGRHQMDFYGEVFTAVLAAGGLVALAKTGSAWGWAALVLAGANTPAVLGGLTLVGIALTLQWRRWRHLAIPVLAALLMVAESWLRRGGPFVSGYEGNAGMATALPYSGRPGFSYPLLFGLLSILFSFGKGLAFFAPGLLLPAKARLARFDPALGRTYALWLLFLAGMVLVYAKWWSWYGGWYWGPRFFLFASVPASLALAVALTDSEPRPGRATAALAVLALSVWMAVTGVVYEQSGLHVCVADGYALEALCWYVPEMSALFHPFVEGKPLSSDETLFMAFAGATFVWLAAAPVRTIAAAARTRLRTLLSDRPRDLRF